MFIEAALATARLELQRHWLVAYQLNSLAEAVLSARVAPSPMESTDESVDDSEVEVDTLRPGKEGKDTAR